MLSTAMDTIHSTRQKLKPKSLGEDSTQFYKSSRKQGYRGVQYTVYIFI